MIKIEDNQEESFTTKEEPNCESITIPVSRSLHSLTHHDKQHAVEKGEFECDICGVKLSRKSCLKNHLRIYTGEKLFQCDVCLQSFARKASLIYHKQTHDRFRCSKCRHCYKNESIGDIHEEKCERPQFECDTCGFKSMQKSKL